MWGTLHLNPFATLLMFNLIRALIYTESKVVILEGMTWMNCLGTPLSWKTKNSPVSRPPLCVPNNFPDTPFRVDDEPFIFLGEFVQVGEIKPYGTETRILSVKRLNLRQIKRLRLSEYFVTCVRIRLVCPDGFSFFPLSKWKAVTI